MAKIKSKSKLSKKIRNIKNVDPVVRTTSIFMIYAKKSECLRVLGAKTAKSTRNKIYCHMSLIVLSFLAYSSQTVNVRKMGMGSFERAFYADVKTHIFIQN